MNKIMRLTASDVNIMRCCWTETHECSGMFVCCHLMEVKCLFIF